MAPEKQKNYFWTDEETIFMLQKLKELNILKFIDGRRTRNAHLFQKVAQRLKEAGFIRTAEQIRVRWKHVKQTYNAAKATKQTGGHNLVACPYSGLLDELLGSRPSSQAGDHGVDMGFSPGTGSQQSGRRWRTADLELVSQRLEEMSNSWRQQLQQNEQSEERLERLVNSIIRSNATMVAALLEGIRSLRPAVAPQPG